MLLMSLVNIGTVVALILQCRPLQKLWSSSTPGSCYDPMVLSVVGYMQGVVNVLTNFFCTMMPVVILWNVKIKRSLKIGIPALMGIGRVATISQICRVVFLKSLAAEDYSCWSALPR